MAAAIESDRGIDAGGSHLHERGSGDQQRDPDDAGAGAAGCRSLADTAIDRYRRVEKVLAKRAGTRVFSTIPKTGGFAFRTMLRNRSGSVPDGLPSTRITPKLLAQVALDEAILSLAVGPERFPHRSDYERVAAELHEAMELYDRRGWLDDPASYHRDPLPIASVQVSSGWAHRLRYERIHYPSGFEPRPEEPGSDRWLGYHTNRTASSWVLRHGPDGDGRPWLVCVHGFGMGYAFMDFPAVRAAHLHHDLGLNLIGPLLPLHGARKVGRMSGDDFLSFDLMNSVHGLAQSAWDVRRVVDYVRRTFDPPKLGLMGVSLGAYVAALVCTLDPDLDLALAGIPVTDFPALFSSQSPTVIRNRSIENGILGGPAETVHRVVSPLTSPVLVPREARKVYAGLGDRMSHPRQAYALWDHWERPAIRWYPGNHVGFMWSSKVAEFVDESIRERLGASG